MLNNNNFITLATKTSSSFYSTESFINLKNSYNEKAHFNTISTLNSIKLIKNSKLNSINTFHKNLLKTKLQKNKQFQNILINKSKLFITNFNSILDQDLNDNDNINEKKINLTTIENENNDKSLEKNYFSKNLFLKIPTLSSRISINKPLVENTSNFLNKINIIRKAKIINKYKNENLKILKEKNILCKEELNQIIFKLNYSKKILEKYKNEFLLYLKYLNNVIYKEEAINEELINKEINLRLKYRALKNKYDITKRFYDQGINYQKLLLKLKYRVSDLSQLPIHILNEYNLKEYIPKKKENIPFYKKNSFYKMTTKKSSILKLIQKKDSINKKINRKSVFLPNNNKLIKNYTPELIYKTSEDFERDIKRMENNCIKLYSKLMEKNKEKFNLEKEKNELLKYILKNESKENIYIKQDEMMLNILKNKYQTLELKLKNLYIIISSNFISNYKKNFFNTICKKLINIILNIPINLENEFNCKKLYYSLKNNSSYILHNGIKKNIIYFCLWMLEQLLLNLIKKNNNYKNDINTFKLIKTIKKQMEKEKRIEYSKKFLNEEKIRKNLIEKKIIEKFNKTLFLPKRKVNYKDNNRLISKKYSLNKTDKNNNNNILSIEDIVYY